MKTQIFNNHELTPLEMDEDIQMSFPLDIPITQDAVVYQVIQVKNGISIVYETRLKPTKVDDLYKNYFNHIIFIGKLHLSDFSTDLGMMKTYEKDTKDGQLRVQIMEEKEGFARGAFVIILFTTNNYIY